MVYQKRRSIKEFDGHGLNDTQMWKKRASHVTKCDIMFTYNYHNEHYRTQTTFSLLLGHGQYGQASPSFTSLNKLINIIDVKWEQTLTILTEEVHTLS